MKPVFRFAPSPNGRLHLGHALSAITGFEMARALGGRFLVRIEDIDLDRSRDDLIHGIFEDLEWLGLDWERPVLRQSERLAKYQRAADRLLLNNLLYPCFATRSEILRALKPGHPLDPDGSPLYPALHKSFQTSLVHQRQSRGDPFALRLDMRAALEHATAGSGRQHLTYTAFDQSCRSTIVHAEPSRWGDAVIVRKRMPASYHLACVIDDAEQGVTHVTRGRDLLAATDLHRLLQMLLGLAEPIYHHHRLVLDVSGRKLSKSAGDTSIASLRAAGTTPLDIRRIVGIAT